jgi:hypothetical protein
VSPPRAPLPRGRCSPKRNLDITVLPTGITLAQDLLRVSRIL